MCAFRALCGLNNNRVHSKKIPVTIGRYVPYVGDEGRGTRNREGGRSIIMTTILNITTTKDDVIFPRCVNRDEIDEVLYPPETIRNRLSELGKEITEYYDGMNWGRR